MKAGTDRFDQNIIFRDGVLLSVLDCVALPDIPSLLLLGLDLKLLER